ncbi:MAG: Rne/Rng family ribonuclease [Hyphomicrobium sp.]|jgi:ribonuclease E
MSNNKMLIDATHPEETRVVVLRNGRVEEFDFESAARKLLRGNIYLAKVTRVEPSLQAAFVEYGGNRHGFLAFNEIHPDYYQIPVADRQALLDEEAAAEAAEEAAVDAHAEALARRRQNSAPEDSAPEEDDSVDDIEPHQGDERPSNDDHDEDDEHDGPEHHQTMPEALRADDRMHADVGHDAADTAANENTVDDGLSQADSDDASAAPAGIEESTARQAQPNASHAELVDQLSTGEDALEELPSRPRRRPRSYKIQEVIKRRQVILVQVVKEERGNKGAALTTYLSLAGRYTVLMPNTARGGGISRKITNPQDRKRLKAIAAELEVPEGMGLIIRTAGAARTKQEIKRDFEYLLRLWESVRDLTLQSQAPSLVYEEGNLIKRSIRDLYNKDVDEVIVAGGEAHREAKDFMRMLMPSHAKNVTQYQEPEPLFTRFQIERQLNAMFSPYVTLRSGGYLVINQTEALVAVDVNSGKATREFSIEETAYHTNLEAADEIARQLKLRDLAGLIVVDFIDMEEKRNNRSVERRLKEALRFDRARIQVGRISHFGLLEMSRQRLRTGVLEGSTTQCPHCQGTGIIRSTESVALAVLRGLEDAIISGTRAPLVATTTPTVALYILNNKRPFIIDMEARVGLPILVTGSDKLAGANFTIEKGAAPALAPRRIEPRTVVNMESGFEGEDEAGDYEAREPREEVSTGERDSERSSEQGSGSSRRRRRRRRGGRRDRDENGVRIAGEQNGNGEEGDFEDDAGSAHDHNDDHEHRAEDEHAHGGAEADDADGPEDQGREQQATGEDGERSRERTGRSRRRGRRGGRRGRERGTEQREAQNGSGEQPYVGDEQPYDDVEREPANASVPGHVEAIADFPNLPADGNDELPAKESPRPRKVSMSEVPEAKTPAAPAEVAPAVELSKAAAPVIEAREQPRPSRRRAESSEPRLERIVVGQSNGAVVDEDASPTAPARKGWWQRKLGG